MPENYFYFVDSKKYESDTSTITGAQIKAAIENFNSTYSLFLEGKGNEEDKLVKDDDSFDLTLGEGGPLRFYTAPPATFGRNW